LEWRVKACVDYQVLCENEGVGVRKKRFCGGGRKEERRAGRESGLRIGGRMVFKIVNLTDGERRLALSGK